MFRLKLSHEYSNVASLSIIDCCSLCQKHLTVIDFSDFSSRAKSLLHRMLRGRTNSNGYSVNAILLESGSYAQVEKYYFIYKDIYNKLLKK